MKYALLIYCDEKKQEAMSEAEMGAIFQGYGKLEEELGKAGKKLGGEALQGVGTATCLQIRSGKRVVKDGPFAETKEQLGGFYLLECANLDEAMDWAAKIPNAANGTVEVRPVWDFAADAAKQ
jgi:hypothetical protein